MLKSLFLVLSLFFCLLFVQVNPIFAAQEFAVSLQATYSIPNQGATLVRNKVQIKNNFSTIFSTQYALEIGSTSLRSIRAYDTNNKDIPIQATRTDKKTSIALTFPDRVVGRDKERIFTIEYEHPDAALITGNVLEIDVPKVTQQDAFHTYTVVLEVPLKYGEPAAAAPPTYATTTKDQLQVFTFTQAAHQGINMLFGKQQQYNFSLKYHIQNPSISQGISQIALPPDTAFQRVVYANIQPKPQQISKDEDGNWIATMKVDAQKELTVTATGYVTTYIKPTVSIDPNSTDSQKYLSDSDVWHVKSPKIQELAKQLKTPRAIYDHLVNTFSYDYRRLVLADQRRRGAEEALETPDQTLCQEFTDTFISLARAEGIPARELNGFAYTQNPKLRPSSLVGDLLHAWPEYYDKTRNAWIPIDPTWGNTTGGVDYFTKLDFNHIVFAIHGNSPTLPYAAGMYKISGKESKDVEVSIATTEQKPTMNLRLSPPSGLKPNTITVENYSGAAWYDVPIRVETSASLHFDGERKQTLNILPYSSMEIPIPVSPSSIIVGGEGTVTVTIGEESVRYDTSTGRISTTTLVGVGLGIASLVAGGVLVFGFLKPRHLRR